MLKRGITLLQAISLNMGMMVGVGPFITIPLFLRAMGGPQAMIGWVLGAVIAIADGMVWSELAAAFPGSGGTFHFYEAIYGARWIGRFLKFLFVWQFLFSAPLELASGAIGLSQYTGYFFHALKGTAWDIALPLSNTRALHWTVTWGQVFAMGAMGGIVWLAYRRIEAVGRLMVVLWAGMLVTVGWMILAGLSRFDANMAFDFPTDAWLASPQNARNLGVALGIAMYDFFGYYQVCYLGDEVRDPARVLPRAITTSVLGIALIYLIMNLGILGVVPAEQAMRSEHIASDFMLVRYGKTAANAITVLILWTGAASTFAGMIGYSRVPYAAARTGHFFSALGATHPTKSFPHRSLLLVGLLSALGCLFDLPTVIGALLASRLLIQFIGQIATVFFLHRQKVLAAALPFRMPMYPIPAVVALVGWIYVFATLEHKVVAYGVLSLALGCAAFAVWDRRKAKPDLDNLV